MLASFFLALREGLEAALIISLMVSSLQKMDRRDQAGSIWLGTLAAVLLSVLAAMILQGLGASFSSPGEQVFEGSTLLLAAGLLTWALLWMGKRSRQLNQQLQADLELAVGRKRSWALFALAFLAVIREGVELALFLTAASLNTPGKGILLGAVLGLGVVILVGTLLSQGLIRLDLKRFFRTTSLILVLFAAGLVAHGVGEFNEVGLIPPIIEHVWDVNPLLDENSPPGQLLKALLGYNGNPSLTEALAYLLYLGLAGFQVLFRGRSVERSGSGRQG